MVFSQCCNVYYSKKNWFLTFGQQCKDIHTDEAHVGKGLGWICVCVCVCVYPGCRGWATDTALITVSDERKWPFSLCWMEAVDWKQFSVSFSECRWHGGVQNTVQSVWTRAVWNSHFCMTSLIEAVSVYLKETDLCPIIHSLLLLLLSKGPESCIFLTFPPNISLTYTVLWKHLVIFSFIVFFFLGFFLNLI